MKSNRSPSAPVNNQAKELSTPDYPIVYIKWKDACSAPEKWMPDNDMDDWISGGTWMVHHVGWLIKETEEFYTVAAMIVHESEYSQGFKGHVHKIPVEWCELEYLSNHTTSEK